MGKQCSQLSELDRVDDLGGSRALFVDATEMTAEDDPADRHHPRQWTAQAERYREAEHRGRLFRAVRVELRYDGAGRRAPWQAVGAGGRHPGHGELNRFRGSEPNRGNGRPRSMWVGRDESAAKVRRCQVAPVTVGRGRRGR